jgi:hypothetical protein
MLSRKNNSKAGLKAHLKEQSLYCSLLKKEFVSDDTIKSISLTQLVTKFFLKPTIGVDLT